MRKSLLTGSGFIAHFRSKSTGLLAALAMLGSSNAQAQYCAAGPTSLADTEIYSVVLNGDNTDITYTVDSTNCAVFGVRDLTEQSADVTQGNSYSITIEGNSCSGSFYGGNVRVWVDWNDDFVFDNATESLGQFSYSGGPVTNNINFTVPAAPAGPHRMRVILNESAVPTSGCATFQWGSAQDYTLVVTAAACPPPVVSLGAVTANSVELVMTGIGLYDIEYGPIGFIQGTGTVLTGVGSPYVVGMLASNSAYDFYVRQTCTGPVNSGWVKVSASTPCATYAAPYLENVEGVSAGLTGTFPGTTIGNCWNLGSTPAFSGSIPRWETETGPGFDDNSYATGPWYDHTLGGATAGGRYFYLETSGQSLGDTAYLVSPPIDLSALANPSLSFYYHMYGATINRLRVDVFAGGMWNRNIFNINGQQQTAGTQAWLQAFVNLSAYSGVVQVRFVGYQGSSYTGDISLDDIAVGEAPSCFPPTVSLGTITSNSVELLMTGSGNYDIEYGPVGFTQGTGTVVNNVGSPYTINMLSSVSTYDFYVRASCSGPSFSGWIKVTATTLCAPYTAPYFENVEGVSAGLAGTFPGTTIGNCWNLGSTSLFSGSNPRWETETGDGFDNNTSGTGPWYDNTLGGSTSGGQYFYLETSWGTDGDTAALVSPDIDISGLTNPELTFYYHMFGVAINQVRVDVWSGGMWHNGVATLSGQQQTSGPAAWQQAAIGLGAYSGTIRVRFVGYQGPSLEGDISIDDIRVDEAPACPSPFGVSVSLDGAGNAVFSWAPNGITEIEIEYGPDGFLQGTGTIAMATGNPAVLAGGFSIFDKHSFYVRFKCDSMTYSAWSSRLDIGGYCDAGPTSTADSDPQDVILNGETLNISNLASCPGQVGIADFTAQVADVRQTKTYSVTVTYGTCSGNSYDGFGSVWIDWNADAVFDPSELIGQDTVLDVDQPKTVTYTFTVPASAKIGMTRMRVMQHEGASGLPLDPCAAFSWGGVEDYSIDVQGCEKPIVLTALVTKAPFCAGALGTLRAAHSGGIGSKTYLWSNGANTKFTSGPAGTYWVTVTDVLGCSATDTVEMSDPAGVQYATSLISVVRSGLNFTVTWNPFVAPMGVTHLGYRVGWRVRNSGAPFVTSPLLGTGVTSYVADLTGYCSANYEFVVYVRYNAGAGGQTSAPSCSLSRGLPIGTPCKDFVDGSNESEEAAFTLAIYPNPTLDVTYLSAPRGTAFELTDLQGRVLETGAVSEAEAAIDLSSYAQGVYLLKATFEGEVRVERIVRR